MTDTAQRPLISVVVPTYNQAEYLGACLDSIWFQDYPNIEIIVDDALRILREFRLPDYSCSGIWGCSKGQVIL